jgi:hypothetical protein
MVWTATLHGDTAGMSATDAEQAEHAVSDALQSIAEGLAPSGQTGVGATFHGDYAGTVNLLQPGETPDAGPGTGVTPDALAALGAGEVSREDVTTAAGVEPGTPVPLAPGQVLEPEIPDPAAQAGDAPETAPGATPEPNAAPEPTPAA